MLNQSEIAQKAKDILAHEADKELHYLLNSLEEQSI
jgi:hypothetical protein